MNLRQLKLKLLGPIIPVISINRSITQKTTEKVALSLQKINKDRMVAIAVSISSEGGQPVQSQIIANKLVNFANSNNVKLYTFANDRVTGAAYYILSAGHHVYADRSSLVGNISLAFMKYHLQGILQTTSIGNKSFATQQNLLANYMNPYKELNQEGRKNLQNITENCHIKMVKEIQKNRGTKLKNSDNQFLTEIYTGQQAVENGLVDQLGTMVEVFSKRHQDAKLIFQKQTPFLQKLLGI